MIDPSPTCIEAIFPVRFAVDPSAMPLEEYGELPMFKALYPKNAKPIVLKLKIAKNKITNIDDYIGYKGGELLIEPSEIIEVINVDWNELNY